MAKIFFQILFIFAVISTSFSIATAMDEEAEGKPRTPENRISKRSCGLGLSNLSLNDQAITYSDETKRAWGLYRAALWRVEVLEEPLSEVVDKFRSYGNACAGLVREKHCRQQAGSSDPLPQSALDAHKTALVALTDLLKRSDLGLLEKLINDKEHRVYKLTEGHEMIRSLLEVKPYARS
jgi:hypothetical protein